MENLKLEGYKEVIPNNVYTNFVGFLGDISFLGTDKAEIIKINRIKIPRKKQVIDCIKKISQEIKSSNFFEKKDYYERNIANFLSLFDKKDLEGIVNDDEEVSTRLEKTINFGNCDPGKKYLLYFNKMFPTYLLSKLNELRSTKRKKDFFHHIEKFSENDVRISLLLSDDFELPPFSEIEYLIKKGVKVSDVFSFSGDKETKDKLKEKIEKLYSSLNKKGSIELIEDNSERLLKEISLATVDSYLERKKIEDDENFKNRIINDLFLENPLKKIDLEKQILN